METKQRCWVCKNSEDILQAHEPELGREHHQPQEREASGYLWRKLCGAYLFVENLQPWNVWNLACLSEKENEGISNECTGGQRGGREHKRCRKEKLRLDERERVHSVAIFIRTAASVNSSVHFVFLESFKSLFRTLVGGKILLKETSFKCLFPKKTHTIPRHTPCV